MRSGYVLVVERLEGSPIYFTAGNLAGVPGLAVLATGAADVVQVAVWDVEADRATRVAVVAGWSLGGTGGELEAIKKAVSQ